MAHVKTLWCVRCGQSGHVNGRGELVHDNFMVTANDHALDPGAPTIPGTVNNFRVLAAIEVTPLGDYSPEWIVLCDRGSAIHDRYVTWRVGYNPDYQGGTYVAHSGRYIDDFAKAMRNFGSRAALYTETDAHERTLEDMIRARDERIDKLQADIDQYIAQSNVLNEIREERMWSRLGEYDEKE